MKTNLLRFAPRFLATCAASFALVGAFAAPLTETTAVHTKPDIMAPVITVLKAGSEPVAAANSLANTPAGWMAVELSGPFEGYVENKDFTKSLDVKPGAPIRFAPKADGGVLATAEKDDKTTITGVMRGKWTQISLDRKLTGYVRVGGAPGYIPSIATTPATAGTPTLPTNAQSGVVAPAPVAPVAYGVTTAGQPAPTMNMAETGANALPRQLVGRFVSTRRPFTPRRPYDWALNDNANKRIAYVDISKLLQTDQIEKYTDHDVVVYGTVRGTVDGKDLVIQIESLQLK
jgi:hypothetical protein